MDTGLHSYNRSDQRVRSTDGICDQFLQLHQQHVYILCATRTIWPLRYQPGVCNGAIL